MKKKKIIQVLVGMIALVVVFCIGAWFYYQPEKPVMALYVVMAGVVLIVNFLVAMFFVSKNFRS